MTTKHTSARANDCARPGGKKRTEKKRADAASLQEAPRANPYTSLLTKLDADRAVREMRSKP